MMNENEKKWMQHFNRKEILETGLCRIVPGFMGPLKAKVSVYFKCKGNPGETGIEK